MATYKVLVVDDSPFMRKIVSDLIQADSEFQVIDTASNGLEATQKVLELKPDVVTMDVEMPEMNGLEALKIIMSQRPLPVIMLSGINEQGMRETIMALESGAFDFIRKPSVSNSQDIEEVGQQLLRQLHTAVHALERKRKRNEQKNLVAEQTATSVQPEAEVPSTSQETAPSAPQERPARPAPVRDLPKRPTASSTPSSPPAAPLTGRVTQPVKPDTTKKTRLDKPLDQYRTSDRSTSPATPPKPAESKTSRPMISPSSAPARKEPEKPAASSVPASAFSTPPASKTAPSDRPATSISKLVAVGCSTGGPRALKSFLEKIPANFPAPIVIVQHMPPNFTRSLAQRLNSLSQINVVEGEHGMPLQPGTAYIAPGGYHMTVARSQGGYRIQLSQDPPRNGHRPSVDTLFASIRPFNDLQRYAVIMTGMGSDGAREMKNLYDSGVIPTFAENEDTCVVYGMPRSAVELGCVNHLLPLPDIAPKLVQIVK
ncbi:protein-glutamate methylesterase/protein-glutamine glutaminase [Paenibacillus kandeliae]|uniref:protein-glutamate methylesterase/protein-glutamine glutaminase n=1 Tax=Paenibacillus kandeliae TaxID=3231269 RepID=UPI003458E8A7